MNKYYCDLFIRLTESQKEINQLLPRKNTCQGLVEFPIDQLIMDKDLLRIVSKLYSDGHHARAVEEAFKYVNNLVKNHSRSDLSQDGSSLMKKVFSSTAPILKINSMETHSERDEQLGYMEIFSGVMTGIRNPRAHESEWEDPQIRAIQLLIFSDHLVQRIKQSVLVERNA